jgi:hypothetical protein
VLSSSRSSMVILNLHLNRLEAILHRICNA